MLTKINKMKGRKGFTLVELLLVVAILAVLAFLAVPAIAQTIRNSRMRTCGSNEKMVSDGIWRWYADQIAAGFTVDIDAENVIAGDLDAVQALIPDSPSIRPYFTPGGVPTCPFDATVVEPYTISVSMYDGGFLDVLVLCSVSDDGGHPRIDDATGGPRDLITDPADMEPE